MQHACLVFGNMTLKSFSVEFSTSIFPTNYFIERPTTNRWSYDGSARDPFPDTKATIYTKETKKTIYILNTKTPNRRGEKSQDDNRLRRQFKGFKDDPHSTTIYRIITENHRPRLRPSLWLILDPAVRALAVPRPTLGPYRTIWAGSASP